MKTLCMLLLLLTSTNNAFSSLSDSVCKSSLWGSITESMIKTSNPRARDVMNSKLDCCAGRDKGGWCGDSHTTDTQWIEVDFNQGVGIRGIVIQKPEDVHRGYVTSISIEFMLKGSTSWQYFSSDPRNPQAMETLGQSVDSTSIYLNPGIAVSKLKINILKYQKSPCLRFDLLGCKNYEDLCPNACLNGGQCVSEYICACSNNYNGDRCENRISNVVCDTALGLESGSITDSMISVSSSTTGKPKQKVRYNCCTGEDNGAWCPRSNDPHPWLEVTLAKPMAVSGLYFQHPSQKDSHTYPSIFMKSFQLKFISALDPLREWRSFNEHIPSIYNSTLYYNIGLDPYLVTDAVRIYPETYTTAPCFRMEVIGCDPTVLCPKDFCKNGGTCMGLGVCKCPKGFYGNNCNQTASTMVHLNLEFTEIIEHVIHTTININFNIHGAVSLINSQNGKAINLTGNSYVTVNNTGFNSCIKDIDTCSSGFTIITNVNLHQLTDNTYIISSGGDLQNHKGIAFFYANHQLHFVVTTTSRRWVIVVNNSLSLHAWHHIELSWSKTSGSSLVIDNHLVGSVSQPLPVVATQVKPLTIGFGYHHQVSILMTINGLQTFDSHRENLIVNGLVTTPAPTPSQQTISTASHTTDSTTILTNAATTRIPTTTDAPSKYTVPQTTRQPTTTTTPATTSTTIRTSTVQSTTVDKSPVGTPTSLTVDVQPMTVAVSHNPPINHNNTTQTVERSDILCNADSIEVFLPEQFFTVPSRVTWLDPNCSITKNSTHYISTIKHGQCGTTVRLTENNVIFENEINANPLITQNILLNFGTYPYVIPVKCIYTRKGMTLSSYQPLRQQVRVYEKRFGHLDIDMRQFETNQFRHALGESNYPRKHKLNSDIFFKVALQNIGAAELGLHLDTCIATKTSTPYDNVFIKLIENGCPKVNFVHLLPSPVNETRFSLSAFEFTSSQSNVVYIHCQASVCLATSQCTPDCTPSSRSKRDLNSEPSHLLSMGPLLFVSDKAYTSNLIANVIAGVSGTVAMVAIVVAVLGWRRKTSTAVTVNDNQL